MGKLISSFKYTLVLLFTICLNTSIASTLRIATPFLVADPDNPYQGMTMPSALSSQIIYDPLVIINKNGSVEPWLLTSWTSDNAYEWNLTVREGVKFSNNTNLTSSSLVQSIEHMQTVLGKTETVGRSFENIDKAFIVSEYELKVFLKEPDPVFPLKLSIWRLPEPQSWKVRRNDPQAYSPGTGAYKLFSKQPGRVVYEENALAWNKPFYKKVILMHVPDQTSRLQAFIAGGVDISLQIGVGDELSVKSIKGNIISRATTRVAYLGFAKEHFKESALIHNQKIRLALNYAVNRKQIADILFNGYVSPTGQLILPGAPGYISSMKPFSFDIEKAKSLLKDAGYPNGIELSARIAISGSDEMLLYQQIAADMLKANIKLNLKIGTLSQMTQMLFSGDYKAEIFSSFGRGLDPLGDYRHRSCLGKTGTFPPYFCDKVSLEYIKSARLSTSFDEMNKLMKKVTLREKNNPLGIFLWPTNPLDAISKDINATEKYSKYYDFIPYHLIKIK